MNSKFTNNIIEKLLDAIDNGISTDELRKNRIKYLVSGETKKIVICRGGSGLKISYEIIKTLADKGDKLSQKLLESEYWYVIDRYEPGFDTYELKDIEETKLKKAWIYFKNDNFDYDRENTYLINIIENEKVKNIGGWELCVVKVYVEPWTYKIRERDDMYGSEYVDGLLP